MSVGTVDRTTSMAVSSLSKLPRVSESEPRPVHALDLLCLAQIRFCHSYSPSGRKPGQSPHIATYLVAILPSEFLSSMRKRPAKSGVPAEAPSPSDREW